MSEVKILRSPPPEKDIETAVECRTYNENHFNINCLIKENLLIFPEYDVQ